MNCAKVVCRMSGWEICECLETPLLHVDQGKVEITCEFCDAQYTYDLVDVAA